MKYCGQSALVIALHAALSSTVCVSQARAAPPVISLGTLNGNNGFQITGSAFSDFSGWTVSAAGDVNGDGIDDLIIGAPLADPNDVNDAGSSYVLFGRTGASAPSLSLGDLDGSLGFRIDGAMPNDFSGFSASKAGDVNGDGIDDLIVGSRAADPDGLTDAGSAFVVFGQTEPFVSALALSSLDGNSGFRLAGAAADDLAGSSVRAAGDVNGDGVDDVIIGADRADPNGLDRAGSSYVVFGRTGGFSSSMSLGGLSSGVGFQLDGAATGDRSGRSVGSAGDVNGDGLDDVVIGAERADPNGLVDAGSSYVVFGNSGVTRATVVLGSLNGSTGFRLEGAAAGDYSGFSVSTAGDVNGDGIDDLIVGAYRADPNELAQAGSGYVVYGRTGFTGPSIALSSLEGIAGFRLDGEAADDRSNFSVSAAGDVNGDGIDDLIVGAPAADFNGVNGIGSSYVVYGRIGASISTIALNSLDGINGFRLNGAARYDSSGRSVNAAGDVNGDGIDDLVVGAPHADANGLSQSGSSYVIYGAREQVFHDGAEARNISTFYPRLNVRMSNIGSSVRWQNGATCNCGLPQFDININRRDGNLSFSWGNSAPQGAVAIGDVYSILQPGDVVGPRATFSTDQSLLATANWRAGATGYIGFQFINANTGRTNYGYAKLRTSPPTGFPAEVARFGVNLTGLPVTIPPE